MSVRWPDVDHPRSPSWSWPPNLLIAQGPAAWPRGRRASSEAEDVLAEAVAWWDVERSGFRDGDRLLRNLGTGGSALDLRLGSSTTPNTNDPLYLAPEDIGYVYAPDVANNGANVPHSAGNQIGDNLDIRIDFQMSSWTVSPAQYIAGKGISGVVGSLAWAWLVQTSRRMQFTVSDGTSVISPLTAANSITLVDGQRARLRCTYVRDTGAGQYAIAFYYSNDFSTPLKDVSSWTQIGSTLTGASIGTMTDYSGAGLAFGNGRLNASVMATKSYAFSFTRAGTNIYDIDCDSITSGSQTSFTAKTGQTVNISRATSGRKTIAMPSKPNNGKPCMLLGADDYLECVDAQQHGLLNFGQADSFTLLTALRVWNTPSSFGRYIDKRGGSGAGYTSWASAATLTLGQRVDDGTNSFSNAAFTLTAGSLSTMGMVVNQITRIMQSHLNGSLSTAQTSVRTLGGLTNRAPLAVGRASGGVNYQDFEFRAAAIWRRPLTTREITVLANSGIWGT